MVGVGFALVSRACRAHGSQLQDFERPPISAQAPLPIEDGPAVPELDGQRKERKKHGEGQQRGGLGEDVDAPRLRAP